MPPALSFCHLNLRWNPFGEPAPEDRPALVVFDPTPLAERLQPGVAVQLVGDHGRGKTSRLLALQHHLDAPYVRLRDAWQIPVAPVVLLDEAEQLWRRPFWRLLQCGALALSTHRDLSLPLRALGFSVETVSVGGITKAQLAALLARRIAWARRGPGPVPCVPPETLDRLVERFGDDVRSMERALYASVQRMREVGDVEV